MVSIRVPATRPRMNVVQVVPPRTICFQRVSKKLKAKSTPATTRPIYIRRVAGTRVSGKTGWGSAGAEKQSFGVPARERRAVWCFGTVVDAIIRVNASPDRSPHRNFRCPRGLGDKIAVSRNSTHVTPPRRERVIQGSCHHGYRYWLVSTVFKVPGRLREPLR